MSHNIKKVVKTKQQLEIENKKMTEALEKQNQIYNESIKLFGDQIKENNDSNKSYLKDLSKKDFNNWATNAKIDFKNLGEILNEMVVGVKPIVYSFQQFSKLLDGINNEVKDLYNKLLLLGGLDPALVSLYLIKKNKLLSEVDDKVSFLIPDSVTDIFVNLEVKKPKKTPMVQLIVLNNQGFTSDIYFENKSLIIRFFKDLMTGKKQEMKYNLGNGTYRVISLNPFINFQEADFNGFMFLIKTYYEQDDALIDCLPWRLSTVGIQKTLNILDKPVNNII